MDNNKQINIFDKILPGHRTGWNLYLDAIYKSDSSIKDISSEVLSKLLNIKNQGGFRYRGETSNPNLVVLFSTGEDIYWKDEFDNNLGIYLYYGDNNVPGNDLHNTNLHGNEILKHIFELASSDNRTLRKNIPPIFVFKKAAGRDVKFAGLAVPGIKGKPSKEWLTAVWGCNKDGDRFQNYKAYFTILDTSAGSDNEAGAKIDLRWLDDIEIGKAFESIYAPIAWKAYIKNIIYTPLQSNKIDFKINPKIQLPDNNIKNKMLDELHNYFINKDNGYSFEKFAADVVEGLDDAIDKIEVTRPYKDGGFDAEGRYKIFDSVDNAVFVEFYMQAKCYSRTNGVNVKDTARLISRIKSRQFGIMITTSYICSQAYEEVRMDKHPTVFITGKDIINYIFDEHEIRSVESLKKWLESRY